MIWPLAIRNARRNVRRTMLTASTVALGCTLLIVGISWLSGLLGTLVEKHKQLSGLVRITTQDYADSEHMLPIAKNMPSTGPLISALKEKLGTDEIYPTLKQGVTVEVDGQIGDVFGLVMGAPIEYHKKQLKLDTMIKEGAFFGDKAKEECLLGRALAKDMKVEIGDKAFFTGQDSFGVISAIKATVVGIVDTNNGVFDRQAYVHIDKARALADIPEGATELLIFGTDEADQIMSKILAAELEMAKLSDALPIDEKPDNSTHLAATKEPQELSVTPWDKREPFAEMYGLAYGIHRLIGIIIVLITALGVMNTMMMSVLERTAEIGVLRAMGMGRLSVAFMFILEAMIIALIGGVLGAVAGSTLAVWMENYGIDLGSAAASVPDTMPINTVLRPHYDPEFALWAIGLGVIMAVIGAAVPILRAIRIKPVEAMRSKRG